MMKSQCCRLRPAVLLIGAKSRWRKDSLPNMSAPFVFPEKSALVLSPGKLNFPEV